MRRAAIAFVASGLAFAAGLSSSGEAPSPAISSSPSGQPCSTPQHRQFDFWVGDWNVKDTQGTQAGTNLVTREFGGCVIQEHWVGSRGMTGGSFNVYTPATARWHQTWVDSSGTLLLLDGELKDGKMQLAGETTAPNGGKVLHRLYFEPRSHGRVRQFWQSSHDSGKTWGVVFDGLYERKVGN